MGYVVFVVLGIYFIATSPLGPYVIVLLPLGYAAYKAWEYRVEIARWYYFTFHPHPAEPMVRLALSLGSMPDGNALANTLGEILPSNQIFREVRVAQAAALIARMEAVTRAQMREMEERGREEFHRAAIQQSQEALALAAIALEKAKAMQRASVGGAHVE